MNFSFAHPLVLLLLVLPVLLCVWEWTRRGADVVLPFDHAPVRRGKYLGRFLAMMNLLPAMLLAVAILVLAGPQRLSTAEREKELTNIQFVLDVSGSMTAQFGDGSRYDAAMGAIHQFIDYRKGDAYGLTIFGNEVLHWVPITKDTSAIKLATPFLRPERMPDYFGGTQIGKALGECQKVLASRPEGDRMIILVTDGMSADLYGGGALELASSLRKDKIVVYIIQTAEGEMPDEMHTVANITGGAVFASGDPVSLATVFKHIDKMQAARLKPPTRDFSDFFMPVAVAGLGLGGLHLLALCGMRYTPW
ncbi:MAG: Ca-activated chloride channel [Phycisphaerales bacterium]|nr:Ca-activated chloride channel [Phycisphaerales bacterium]